MQGDGLKILSGEKQRALQEQTEAAKATSVVLERVNKELQAKVCSSVRAVSCSRSQ